MAVVTITGHLGAVGTIPARVANELGYLLADRRLLTQAAGALGWSEPQAEAYDERTDAQRGRMSQFLSEFVHLAPFTPIDDIDAYTLESLALGAYGDWVASAEMRPADRRFLGVLTALVKSLAEAGDVVIVGRGSQAILGDRDDAVHVQVVCDLEERVRRIAERDNIEAAAANARIQESDRERNLWYRKYFSVDFESPHLYDVILNTARLGEDEVTHQVISLVRARVIT